MGHVLVLGSGQLGRMLAEAASRLGLSLDRLDPERWALLRGTSPVPEDLPPGWDGRHYDLVTVEREHFSDRSVLQRFAGHPGFRLMNTLDCVADRRRQKALLDRLEVATAEWCIVRCGADLERLQARLGTGLIVKAATGGYDGRGQWRFEGGAWKLPAGVRPGELIAERKVAFDRELSLVGARTADGECVFYPLVENVHRDGMLRCTVAPANVTPFLQHRAQAMLGRIMQDLDYVGVMAMECFEEEGRLLVNELAPRVHNSGHWSQEGASIDQFDMHLRALVGLPLLEPRVKHSTVMLNLVGVPFDPGWLATAAAGLHWYGKAVRPARKVGHLNIYAAGARDLLIRMAELQRELAAEHRPDVEAAIGILERIAAGGRLAATAAGGLREDAASAGR